MRRRPAGQWLPPLPPAHRRRPRLGAVTASDTQSRVPAALGTPRAPSPRRPGGADRMAGPNSPPPCAVGPGRWPLPGRPQRRDADVARAEGASAGSPLPRRSDGGPRGGRVGSRGPGADPPPPRGARGRRCDACASGGRGPSLRARRDRASGGRRTPMAAAGRTPSRLARHSTPRHRPRPQARAAARDRAGTRLGLAAPVPWPLPGSPSLTSAEARQWRGSCS